MVSSFDQWNRRKKFADLADSVKYPKQREIWMCTLGRNVGSEENGGGPEFMRPVLVVKSFNTRMVWCVPLTLRQKGVDFYVNYTDSKGRPAAAVVAQLRMLSTGRLERRIGRLDGKVFERIRRKAADFLT